MMLSVLFLLLASAQEHEAVPEHFVLTRPGKPPEVPAVYRKQSSDSPSQISTSSAQLGLTIWRLRPARPQDTGERPSMHQEGLAQLVAERLAAGELLHAGERIRLSVESPKAGYLYIFDREQYARGGNGEPFLIYPTMRIRGGDNEVSAGKVADIPAQEDQPNYMTVRKTRPDHLGELLTVIVSAEPLTEIAVGPNALHVEEKLVARWEKQWAQKMEMFTLAEGAGRQRTAVEQSAALPGDARLTASDPAPQIVFQTDAAGSTPILIHVQLRYTDE